MHLVSGSRLPFLWLSGCLAVWWQLQLDSQTSWHAWLLAPSVEQQGKAPHTQVRPTCTCMLHSSCHPTSTLPPPCHPIPTARPDYMSSLQVSAPLVFPRLLSSPHLVAHPPALPSRAHHQLALSCPRKPMVGSVQGPVHSLPACTALHALVDKPALFGPPDAVGGLSGPCRRFDLCPWSSRPKHGSDGQT